MRIIKGLTKVNSFSILKNISIEKGIYMKKIILCILLFASFIFALNCQLLTEEQKETMAREHFTEIPAIINSGIMCEDGLYYNATSVLFVDL